MVFRRLFGTKSDRENSMSKHLKIENLSTYRNEIYGIAAIWIMLFHGRIANIDATFPYLYKILRLGNIGVDIFLFLSGIGIFFFR